MDKVFIAVDVGVGGMSGDAYTTMAALEAKLEEAFPDGWQQSGLAIFEMKVIKTSRGRTAKYTTQEQKDQARREASKRYRDKNQERLKIDSKRRYLAKKNSGAVAVLTA